MKILQTTCENTPVEASFNAPTLDQLPTSAQVVIVGGGIAGCGLAYHFAKNGWQDVLLLEQNKIASGTTWHSAGQVGQLRSSSAQTRVNKASANLYARLKQETGHDPGWLQCGGLQLAASEERMHQLQRQAALADVFDVEAEVIPADQCGQYWPMLNTSDLQGGVYLPGDGRVMPGECTVALAKGALSGGVQIAEGVSVQQLHFDENRRGAKRFHGLSTNRGEIQCEWIVLACNMWMRQLGLTVGIDIPVYPCEHHYVLTRPMEGVTRNAPCTRDPDAGNYFRAMDDGSMTLGVFKKRSKPWQIGDAVPNDFAFSLLEPDWPDFQENFKGLQHRLGVSRKDVVKFINGPEAFTPDNNFIMGQPFMTDGLFVMGGWNSAGIACSGGAAKFAVDWLDNGGMTEDLCSVDVRRFIPFQNKRAYLQERVSEVLGLHYQMAWPGRAMETSRGQRASALFEVHKEHNAVFGQTAGWERPRFYAPPGVAPEVAYSFVRQNWHPWVTNEVQQCRENVALLDQSTFGKYMLEGKHALDVLQNICGNDIDCEVQQSVYTGLFNAKGTFEGDLVVARLDTDRFYIVTSTAQQRRDFDWIARHIPEDADATLTDVTEQYNVLSVMGPNASLVLRKLNASLAPDKALRYGSVVQCEVGNASVTAIRVSYVGESGCELHVKSSDAVALYQSIMDAGSELNIGLAGTEAISTMRIEKGFRAFGHELSPAENPFEAGLQPFINWSYDFIGKSALLALREVAPRKRLVCFRLENSHESDVVLWGSEPIYAQDQVVGYTSSACFSPTLGTSVAMGYVDPELLQFESFSIKQRGTMYPAIASLKAFV